MFHATIRIGRLSDSRAPGARAPAASTGAGVRDRVRPVRARTPSRTSPEPAALGGHDRVTLVTHALLLAVTGAAWFRLLTAPGMDDMAGMDMAMTPTFEDGLVYVAAWAVMMAAMMLPSALPMIGLYAATQRNASSRLLGAGAIALFALVYLALWAATGVPIYLANVALSALGPRTLAYTIATVLVVAGVFQVTALKQACLRGCRSPLGFLLGRWRPGWRGALALGTRHGAYCLGCCWAVMALLFAAGVMNLLWVAGLSLFVLAEKLAPRQVSRAGGAAMVAAGVWMLWP
jgi:predicted metal-binding membrane protein